MKTPQEMVALINNAISDVDGLTMNIGLVIAAVDAEPERIRDRVARAASDADHARRELDALLAAYLPPPVVD